MGPGHLAARAHSISDCDFKPQQIDEAMPGEPLKGCWKWGAQAQRGRFESLSSGTYHSFQIPHQQPIQYLPRLVTVSHILKGLGCVLAAHVKEHFLSPTVTACQLISSSSPHSTKVETAKQLGIREAMHTDAHPRIL